MTTRAVAAAANTGAYAMRPASEAMRDARPGSVPPLQSVGEPNSYSLLSLHCKDTASARMSEDPHRLPVS